MNHVGTYQVLKFPTSRNPTIDTLEVGRKKHHIPILLEVDVTDARECIRQLRIQSREKISFTGWAMKCIAQAISEHKQVQAMRKGNRRLVLFDDIDIAVIIERRIGKGDRPSETLPMPYIVRKANEKTVREIHQEITIAKAAEIESGEVQLGATRSALATKAFSLMPSFLRSLLVWRRLTHDPFFAKEMMGTVVVTSVGGSLKGSGYGWAIPTGLHPIMFALGSIARKPGVIDEEIKIRDYLSLTVLFDHDITDGAPVARFIRRLKALLETPYGL